jgi:Flp pilus assembly pilin Flp
MCNPAKLHARPSLWSTPRRHTAERGGAPERGASLVEYALLIALIAMVCIAAVTSYGKSLTNSFSRAGASVEVSGT